MVGQFVKAWQAKDWQSMVAHLSKESALSWFEEGLVYGPEAFIAKFSTQPVVVVKQSSYLSYTLIEMTLKEAPILVKVVTVEQTIGLVVVVAKNPNLHRTRFTLAYDGSRYQGFQRQPHGHTVQNLIETALFKLFKQPFTIHAASRTDAGVHAKKQVFHVDLPSRLDRVAELLDRLLPDDVHIYAAEAVPQLFHSRYDARRKTYHYRLIHTINPFLSHQALHYDVIDLDRLNAHLKPLIGRHDFGAFTVRNDKNNTIRTLYTAHAFMSGEDTIIEWIGDGFLRHMVRMMVGHVLYDLEHQAQTVTDMLTHPTRQHQAVMAPARGLYLHDIEY